MIIIIESYTLAVIFCFIAMLCWGTWANTQKLARKEWKFQLFYPDYCIPARKEIEKLLGLD